MKVMIHAVPQRMWYVEEFLLPALCEQGMDMADVTVRVDSEGLGNLESCMRAFEACNGDGGTWHLQDDVLIARDFVERCRGHDFGVVYGFCCRQFNDDPRITAEVYMPDAWHSFQCVRIPDAWARECAEWVRSGAWEAETSNPELHVLAEVGKGDDTFFREFLLCRHGDATVVNLKPNLVEHVDLWIGGSVLSQWRDFRPTAQAFPDPDLVDELRAALRARNGGRP